MTNLLEYRIRGFDGDDEEIHERVIPMGNIEEDVRIHTGERSVPFTKSQIRDDVEKLVVTADEEDDELADEIPDKHLRVMPLIAEDIFGWRLTGMSSERIVFEKGRGDAPGWLKQHQLKSRYDIDGNQANALIDAFRTWDKLENALDESKPLESYDGIGEKTAEAVRGKVREATDA